MTPCPRCSRPLRCACTHDSRFRIPPDRALYLVAQVLGVPMSDLKRRCPSRARNAALKVTAYWLIKQVSQAPDAEIAALFGRDRTTIVDCRRAVERRMKRDREFAVAMARLERRVALT